MCVFVMCECVFTRVPKYRNSELVWGDFLLIILGIGLVGLFVFEL